MQRISQWPAAERPRERLLKQGPAALSDAELLAICLRTGVAGKSAVFMARELLEVTGGLRGALGIGQQEAINFKGLGPAKLAQLMAIGELAKRIQWERLDRGQAIASPQETASFFSSWLSHQPRETFACLYLDNRHRVITCEALFHGTIDGASVYPRDVVRHCLEHGAAAVIFAHNHPSGIAEPSDADRRITRRLIDALALVDIRVLDHLVVGDGDSVSFAERGLI